MRLHLGAGTAPMAGWTNCDLYPGPGIDLAFDLQDPWPVESGQVSNIYASHVLEHLDQPQWFFAEAWRVLRPDGECFLRVPYGQHRAAWWDITHRRAWFAESFAFLQPGYMAISRNLQHHDQQRPGSWQIAWTQLRLGGELAPWLRRKWLRRLLLPRLQYFTDVVEELFVLLLPLKTAEAVARFQATRQAAVVPTGYVMWLHDLERRALQPDEPLTLVRLGVGECLAGYIAPVREEI